MGLKFLLFLFKPLSDGIIIMSLENTRVGEEKDYAEVNISALDAGRKA